MSESKDVSEMDIPSIIISDSMAGRNHKKYFGSKNNNKIRDPELGTGASVQSRNESGERGFSGLSVITPEAASEALHSVVEHKTMKRNKSLSFFLDDDDVSATKKPKHDDIPMPRKQESRLSGTSRPKQHKKNRVYKNQTTDEDMEATPGTSSQPATRRRNKRKAEKPKPKSELETTVMKQNGTPPPLGDNNNLEAVQKLKTRKRSMKLGKLEIGEPEVKLRRSSSEEELTEVLLNMHITGIPSTVTNELDAVPTEPRVSRPMPTQNVAADANEFDLKKVVSWTKKRWNRDSMDAVTMGSVHSAVVVENLPVVMTSVYCKKLLEVFEKYGPIKRIGTADVLPYDPFDELAVFNTTIHFACEDSALRALNEDGTYFAGAIIRVRLPKPPETSMFSDSEIPLDDMKEIFGGSDPLRSVRVAPTLANGMGLDMDMPADRDVPSASSPAFDDMRLWSWQLDSTL